MSELPLSIGTMHFTGIGGIGMSALARYFHANNKYVAGYDKTSTEITDSLVALGINIHFDDSVANIENRCEGECLTRSPRYPL